MQPIGPLMIEHRLIERMIRVMAGELEGMGETGRVDVALIDTAVNFIRAYADRCHHGKEEDILFRELKKKGLAPEHRRTLDELVQEHVWGRRTVGELVEARRRYATGDEESVGDIRRLLCALVEFYPRHIEKEDKRFFIPAMGYFTEEERDAMLRESYEFDRTLIHERYKGVVSELERARDA